MLHMLVRGEDVVCRKLRSSAGDVLLAYPQCDALKHTTLVSANLSQPAAGELGCLTPSTPPPLSGDPFSLTATDGGIRGTMAGLDWSSSGVLLEKCQGP